MASISKAPNGRRVIQFMAPDGRRRSIRLGKVSQRQAEAVKLRVECLAAAAISGHTVDDETARWVAALDDTLHGKLAAVGLIPKREAATLGPFLDNYAAGRTDAKPASLVCLGHTRRNLVDFFGADRAIRTIGPADADSFKTYLVGLKLAPSTIARRLQYARHLFGVATRRKLIGENPFTGVSHPTGDVSARQRFIDRETTARLLDAAPDSAWRTIIALARFSTLKCPSEVLSLRWCDVNWATERIRVTSPKTAHHPGKASRLVPMFPELKPYLQEAWDVAEDGAVYVVPKYQESAQGPRGWQNANLRTQFERIIKRAGLEPWPRLFQNLRSSRETELSEQFPIGTVTAWCGNTPQIALRHYLGVPESDFAKAVQNPVHRRPKVVQKQVQPMSADGCQKTTEPLGKQGVRRVAAPTGNQGQIHQVGDTGLEPVTPSLSS